MITCVCVCVCVVSFFVNECPRYYIVIAIAYVIQVLKTHAFWSICPFSGLAPRNALLPVIDQPRKVVLGRWHCIYHTLYTRNVYVCVCVCVLSTVYSPCMNLV